MAYNLSLKKAPEALELRKSDGTTGLYSNKHAHLDYSWNSRKGDTVVLESGKGLEETVLLKRFPLSIESRVESGMRYAVNSAVDLGKKAYRSLGETYESLKRKPALAERIA